MSNIFTSDGARKGRIADLDLGINRLGPQRTNMPQGGFIGVTGQHQHTETPNEYIARMKDEAEQLLAQAVRDAEMIQREAYEAGFAEGERAGEKLALQKVEPVMQKFEQLMTQVEKDRDELIKRHEQDLIRIAFSIATQVVQETIKQEPETVVRVMNAAMLKINRSQKIKLIINPQDRTLILHHIEQSAIHEWAEGHLAIESDEEVTRGGCRLESETGNIDATIETQLRVLKDALWDGGE